MVIISVCMNSHIYQSISADLSGFRYDARYVILKNVLYLASFDAQIRLYGCLS